MNLVILQKLNKRYVEKIYLSINILHFENEINEKIQVLRNKFKINTYLIQTIQIKVILKTKANK